MLILSMLVQISNGKAISNSFSFDQIFYVVKMYPVESQKSFSDSLKLTIQRIKYVFI